MYVCTVLGNVDVVAFLMKKKKRESLIFESFSTLQLSVTVVGKMLVIGIEQLK